MKKKSILTLVFGILFIQTTLAQSRFVGAGTFDNWIESFRYEDLSSFATSASNQLIIDTSVNVEKVITPGGLGARLVTKLINNNDFNIGFIINGKINFSSSNEDFPGGVGYTAQPDSISIIASYDIKENDSALLMAVFKKNEINVNVNVFKITGKSDGFVELKFKLGNYLLTPDSLFLAVTSSNVFGEFISEGSEITVDKITLIGNNAPQVPNNELNNWEMITIEDPVDYYSFNIFKNALALDDFPVKKITESKSGPYAIQIESMFVGEGIEAFNAGIITTSPFFGPNEPQQAGIPYTEIPSKVTLDYKYLPKGIDTAIIYVQLTKYNSVINGREIVGEAIIDLFERRTIYTHLEVPIETTDNPDTVNVFIISGNNNQSNDGSILILDNLSFDNKTNIFELAANTLNAKLSAIGSSEVLLSTNLEQASSLQLEIRDVTGKLIQDNKIDQVPAGKQEQRISTKNMNQGIYLYQIISEQGKSSGKVFLR